MPTKAKKTTVRSTASKKKTLSSFVVFESEQGAAYIKASQISAILPAKDETSLISMNNTKSILVKGKPEEINKAVSEALGE